MGDLQRVSDALQLLDANLKSSSPFFAIEMRKADVVAVRDALQESRQIIAELRSMLSDVAEFGRPMPFDHCPSPLAAEVAEYLERLVKVEADADELRSVEVELLAELDAADRAQAGREV